MLLLDRPPPRPDIAAPVGELSEKSEPKWSHTEVNRLRVSSVSLLFKLLLYRDIFLETVDVCTGRPASDYVHHRSSRTHDYRELNL